MRATLMALVAFTSMAGCKDDPKPSAAPAEPGAEPGEPAPAGAGHRLEPRGCDPVTVVLTPPPQFEAMPEDGEVSTVRWKRAGAGGPPFEFLSVDVLCVGDDFEPTDVDARVRHLRRVLVDDQKEFPFASAGNPAVQKLRKRVEVIADETRDGRRFLELRTTYPDGLPGGFVFEHYEGSCWRHDPGTPVAIELRHEAPLALESEARRRLAGLCADVALR